MTLIIAFRAPLNTWRSQFASPPVHPRRHTQHPVCVYVCLCARWSSLFLSIVPIMLGTLIVIVITIVNHYNNNNIIVNVRVVIRWRSQDGRNYFYGARPSDVKCGKHLYYFYFDKNKADDKPSCHVSRVAQTWMHRKNSILLDLIVRIIFFFFYEFTLT